MPRRRNPKRGRFTVGDHPGYETAGAALSYAQNVAKTITDGSSLYVRDVLGDTVFRVDRIEGVIHTTRLKEV